jgi:hypothetical protein
MNTTNYVLELLIAGISTIIWLLLLSIALWGYWWPIDETGLNDTDKLIFTVALLPMVYVIGVISDRMVDLLFDRYTKTFLNKTENNGETSEDYKKMRSIIYLKANQPLIDLYEYSKMRMRICRNWAVNSILILVSLMVLVWTKHSFLDGIGLKLQLTITAVILLGGSSLVGFIAWKSLKLREHKFLVIQSKMLKKQAEK